MARRAIIVSPYFPPSTLAGVHRARLLVRHLPAHGWEPVVICVDERYHAEPLDPDLASLVPADARLVKVGALPRGVCRAFGVGDLSLRGWFSLRRAVFRLLAAEGADVLFITMGPFYTSLMARGVKRRFQVPVVLDYQDPWVSRWGATLPRWTKGGWSHRLAVALEPHALRWADHVTAVSEGTNREIMERHPALDAGRFEAIPIGGDPADFDRARAGGVTVDALAPEPKRLHFSHVGTLLPRASETLRALLRAVAALRGRRPDLAARLRLDFVGTSNQPGGNPCERVAPIARQEGVADLVREVPQRVPYLEALAIMVRSHALLALGSDERHYTASKIYPILLSGRPCLAIFHAASSVCEVVRRAGGALLVTYDDTHGACDHVAEIAAALETIADRPAEVGAARREELAPYLADAVAARFAAVFEQAAAAGPRGPNW